MIKICIGKPLHPFWKKQNCYLSIEGPGDFIALELKYSKSLNPYPGGLISLSGAIKLRDYLSEQIESLVGDNSTNE